MSDYISKNEVDTRNWAKNFAQTLEGGELIGLVGDLGAGKTTISQEIAKELGVTKNVNSPTFVIMKIYPTENNSQIKTLVHIDAYRLESEQDLETIGAIEYFGRNDTVVLLEWPEIIKSSLPKKSKIISIKINNKSRRIKEE